jgi:hypothetical protein
MRPGPNIGLQRTSACGLAAEAGSFGVRTGVVAFVIGLLVSVAGAQQTSQAIQALGYLDRIEPLGSATVVLERDSKAGKKPQRLSKKTGNDGIAVFEGLEPGKYVIRVSFPAFIGVSSDPVSLPASSRPLKFILNVAPVKLGCEDGADCFQEHPLLPPRKR